jgi:hypothetical protein
MDMLTVVEELTNILNSFGIKAKAEDFHEALYRTHRSLQQNFWKMIYMVMEMEAGLEDHQYDLRNEDSIKFCREVVEKVKARFRCI